MFMEDIMPLLMEATLVLQAVRLLYKQEVQ